MIFDYSEFSESISVDEEDLEFLLDLFEREADRLRRGGNISEAGKVELYRDQIRS